MLDSKVINCALHFILLNKQQIFMRKYILALAGVALLPLFGYLISKSKPRERKRAQKYYVGVELGGTNFNVAIAQPIFSQAGQVIDFKIVRRKNGHTYHGPQQALSQIRQFIELSRQALSIDLKSQAAFEFLGIASFGPLCLNPKSQQFGSITTTPKASWKSVNVLQQLGTPLNCQKGIDTDVNACAYAEYRFGNHGVSSSLAYVTVGTGVGVGVIANGKPIHGLTHPEGGHVIVERHIDEYEGFKGACPFHKEQTCLQGMVCNKSIASRLKVDFTALAEVSEDPRVWKLVGFYLAQLCLSITLLLSPQKIVIGGGIMNRAVIYGFIRQEFIRLLANYVDHPLLKLERVQEYIVPPKLGADVGVIGAMTLSLK